MPPAPSSANAAFLKSSNKNQLLIKVGKVIDAQSLKGEIKVHLFSREAAWLSSLKKAILKSSAGQSREFSVQSARIKDAAAIIKMAGIEDRTQAENLKGYELWIP